MIAAFYIIILSLNLFLCIINRKSKVVIFLSALFMILLISGNDRSGDTENYLVSYNNVAYNFSFYDGPLFWYAMRFCKLMGIDFFQFKIICALIIICNYFFFIRNIKIKDIHFLMAFYLLYIFFFDIEQFRNALAFSLYLLGYSIYKVKTEKGYHLKRGRVIFFVLILLSTAIHALTFFYLITFIVDNLINSKISKLIPYMVVTLLCCLKLVSDQFDLGGVIYKFIGNGSVKLRAYLQNRVTWGFLLPLGLQVIAYMFISYIYKTNKRRGNESQVVNFIYRNFQILFIVCFFYLNSITFYRVIRNFIPLIVIASLLINENFSRKSLSNIKIKMGIILMIVPWFVYDILIRLNDIFIPVLTSNHWL